MIKLVNYYVFLNTNSCLNLITLIYLKSIIFINQIKINNPDLFISPVPKYLTHIYILY